MKKNLLCAGTAVVIALCACNEKTVVPAIDLANFDNEITPGQDFYQYATGGWQKNHPLKPEYSRYGSFDILRENNEIRMNDLFKELASKKNPAGSNAQKIADLYTMGLDSVRLNNEGISPILPYLESIECVNDPESFAVASGKMAKSSTGGSIWAYYVGADMKDCNTNILYICESGLSMRNRDYYLLEQHQALRDGYKNFLLKIFTLAGYENAEQMASDAFEVEMAIAVPFWSMVQQRDVEAQYNPMSSEELFAKYPNLYLNEYFAQLGIADQDKLVVEQPSYFEALNEYVSTVAPEKLRHYLQASILRSSCGYVSDDFYEAQFDFFSKQMQGIQEQKPRWKRSMNFTDRVLSEAVGELYVEKYFPEKDKEKMLSIVKNIQASLSDHIAALDWMSEQTKAKAQEKLAAFTVKIGYPDKWKDYSSLVINPEDSYAVNAIKAGEWYVQDELSELGQKVDREKWYMSPQTVNAYYNPTTNEICFPAGILQPPFFNSDADDAVNYGAIGVVISHEMTHGFDDQGRLFDKDGNMNNWWTEEDAEKFKAKTSVLVDQFNKVEVLPGVFANGEATLGENIADQGGLGISYSAMQKAMGENRPEPVDGFTPEQRFFLGYANVWATNITDEEIRNRTLTDVHSLGRNRVNVSLRNFQSFFDAFGIKEGDPMWRPVEERVMIW